MAKVRHKRRDALVLYPHHRKPFRVHHVASLLAALALVFACIFELGVVVGHQQRPAAPAPASASKPDAVSATVVRSGYGFSFAADSSAFTASGTELDSAGATVAVTGNGLRAGRPLVSATVRGKPGALSGRLAATQFSVRVDPDPAALANIEKQPGNTRLTPVQAAAKLFPATAGSEVTAKTVSDGPDTLNDVPVQKTVYQFTSKHGGGRSYAIVWSGVVKGRAFAVKLDGLAGSRTVPDEFAAVLDSLKISAGQAVLGADTIFAAPTAGDKGKLDPKYLSDALSPAVVQIFHTVCGVLTVDGQALGKSDCISFSGSGFLATQSGYIATNGHVVVYTAKDALADLITSNAAVLQAYLQGIGLTKAQINATKSDPAALAALISKIYDLPDSQLHFSNEGELTLVALGNDEPDTRKLVKINTSAQLAQFRQDTATIKQASLVADDYNSKDDLTAIADPQAGFSSSDVALLKINVRDAPLIPIETGQVVQNEQVVIMGFPGDANNPLTDNQRTDVTVTDGVVSSIRQAAGGKGRLYQSDADASHGSSGGPAVDEDGKVIGLMTYRYADTETGDSAKSYIRDIHDFTALAAGNGVTIDGQSATQDAWEHGLKLYSDNHYSAALKDFYEVQAAYPAQRLADSYIASAKQAIADGKDVKDVASAATLIIILVAALIGFAAAAIAIIRHHALHRVYRTSVPDTPDQQPVYMAKPPQPPQPPNDQPGPS